MVPHSSTLAWKIPWMKEPGGLQSMGLLRVGHDWATSLSLFTCKLWRRKWQPTPVFLPGESQGQRSLVGRRLWGRTASTRLERLGGSRYSLPFCRLFPGCFCGSCLFPPPSSFFHCLLVVFFRVMFNSHLFFLLRIYCKGFPCVTMKFTYTAYINTSLFQVDNNLNLNIFQSLSFYLLLLMTHFYIFLFSVSHKQLL